MLGIKRRKYSWNEDALQALQSDICSVEKRRIKKRKQKNLRVAASTNQRRGYCIQKSENGMKKGKDVGSKGVPNADAEYGTRGRSGGWKQ
jgi:hypothetical protein